MKVHLIFRLRSFWIGAHWSSYNRRLCINLVPGVTLAITFPGGHAPDVCEYPRLKQLR